jgi:tetratricopeptide (TPR) repeat protein
MAFRISRVKLSCPYLLFATTLPAFLGGGDMVASAAFPTGVGMPTRAAQSLAVPAQQSAPARDPEAATAEALKKALAPNPAPELVRQQKLDALFERLRDARKPEEAREIAIAIERLWLQSSSDTANLLMQRAAASIEAQNFALALSLLDKLVVLEPDWAEAWNERATVRFLIGDLDGAMVDINQVLRLEPRHFGALTGMGMILQREGFDQRALEVFTNALAIYPLAPDIQKLAEKLKLDVEGRDI